MEERERYIAKTFFGLESPLGDEMKELGLKRVRILNRAVEFYATKEEMYLANYSLRCAISILKPLFTFEAKNEHEFYRNIKRFSWMKLMSVEQTFIINNSVKSDVFTHSHYISLKMKDAIVDRFREERRGKRPSIDSVNPDFRFFLKINGTKCSVSLDTSGDVLFKRGYRIATNEAPLNEVLAAGLLRLSGWDKETSLLDPVCGSGTFAIEAAMRAMNIPGGYYRESFGFMQMKDFDHSVWNKMEKAQNAKILDKISKIYGSDISSKSLACAHDNIDLDDKLKRNIRFKKEDVSVVEKPASCSLVICNPPYGERLSNKESVNKLYQDIGRNFKRNFPNTKLAIISSNKEALDGIDLELEKEISVLNGSLACSFRVYNN